MTIRTVVPLAARRDARRAASPFSVIDELNCYFDSVAEPNNVQLEVWLPGHLSPEKLRTATTAALADVPSARARRADGGWWRAGFAWEVPPQPDVDPVSVTGWQDDAQLDLARTRFLAAAPDLGHSPPFRLLLAQGPRWDAVILNAHHAAFDGRSCVQLLRLIADRYSGRQPPAPGPGDATVTVAPSGGWAEGHREGRGSPASGLPLPVRRAARIASQHAGARAGRDAPGYALRLLEWPGVPATPDLDGRSRVTVNDVLIAALIVAIARWNTPRRRRPAPIRISMPIDTRPPGDAAPLGNLSRLCTVTVDPHHVADLAAAVASQTKAAKAAPGPAASPVLMMLARTRLPVRLKRSLVRLGLHTLGSIRCDSSLLSNLGNVTDPPTFGMLAPTRMWFSTSAHMPRGLSVGAITVGGRLQLCFRYRNALLDAAAGREFAAEYAMALSALSAPSALSPASALAAPSARSAVSAPSAPSGPAGEETSR
jgi:NRPS condensation-like uncharacterized protein